MNINPNDTIDDIFDEIMDFVNETPFTTQRINNYNEAIAVNQQLVNNIYNIRRYLEINDNERIRINNTTTRNQFANADESNFIDSLFETFLDNNINTQGILGNVDDLQDVKVTLSQSDFNKLEKIQIKNSNLNDFLNSQCNICMEEYKIDEFVIKLKCKHLFHKECIKDWLCKEKISCPVCRMDVREMI